MNRLLTSIIAALAAALALAAPAGAIGSPPKVTVGLPANNSWAKAVPSFTFSVTGSAVQKTCVLSGPDTYIDEDPCSSPFRPVDSLPDGTYTYTVLATNTDGSDSGSTSFKLDRTAPTVTMQSGVTEGYHGNGQIVSYKGIYADANIDTVTCRLDSGPVSSCGSGGNFQATYDSFGEGAHKFIVVATDKAGNSGYLERNFSIDRTAPSASINLVGGSGESNDNTPAFTLAGSDASGPVTKRCRIENQIDWTDCNADTWVASDGVADGFVTAWIEVRDRAGNNSYAQYSFTLDSTMPSITYGGFDADKTTSTTPDIEFWVDDVHESASAKCGYDPENWDALADCTEGAGHVPAAALALGAHQFWISATDTFGNVASAIYNFEVVLPAPTGGDVPNGGGQGGSTPSVAVKAKSSKVKKGKFTLTVTVTATNVATCKKADVLIAPKVKKAKTLKIRASAKGNGATCVATARIKLSAKFKAKKAKITAAQGAASKQVTVKL